MPESDLIDLVDLWLRNHREFTSLYWNIQHDDYDQKIPKVLILYKSEPRTDGDGWILSINIDGALWPDPNREFQTTYVNPADPRFLEQLEISIYKRLNKVAHA